jgi:hypothetical protein
MREGEENSSRRSGASRGVRRLSSVAGFEHAASIDRSEDAVI